MSCGPALSFPILIRNTKDVKRTSLRVPMSKGHADESRQRTDLVEISDYCPCHNIGANVVY